MGTRPFDPRLVALVDDACWLIYRLFGISARVRHPGLDLRDRPWEFQVPWVCHFIHTGEAWSPSNPDPNWKSGCKLADPEAATRPGPSRTACLSGMTHVSIPVKIGKSGMGTVTLGPFLIQPPTEARFTELCRRLKTSKWAHLRWAHLQGPYLTPRLEKELVVFTRNLFERIGTVSQGESNGRPEAPATAPDSIMYEFAYPPLRLAEDFPLHIYGVFVGFGEMKPGIERGAPSQLCRLEYIENGRCAVNMNGRAFEQSRGQFLLILPGDRAVMEPAAGTDKCERISVTFHGTASLLSGISGKPLESDHYQLALLSRITDLAAAANDLAHRNTEVKILLAQLLFAIRRGSSTPVPPAPQENTIHPVRHGATVREIKRYLDDTNARMPLSAIARLLHMTVPTLRRQFKAASGLSPVAYRRQQQVIKARLLLRSGNQSVSEVSRRLGFCSIHYFSGVFRKLTGMSPSVYSRSLMVTDRQTEEAELRLREHLEKPATIARKLGFDSPQAFAQSFRQRTGQSPTKFGKDGGKKRG